MPRGGKRTAKDGKKIGRPQKPKIELSADSGIATTVLASINETEYWRFMLHAEEMADPVKRAMLTREDVTQIRITMEYLTNRRDGKPAQGMFAGDTREMKPLGRGDLPSHFDPSANTGGVHKPN